MRASLFIACYNDPLYPETGRAVVSLLERLGVELEFRPRQTCCGQMHANTVFRGEAFSQAKRFVHLYEDAENVVVPASSCVAMIRDRYPGLIQELGNTELRDQFEVLLPRVHELSEFLIDSLGVEDVGAYFPHRVTYHASCHGLRGLHLGDRYSHYCLLNSDGEVVEEGRVQSTEASLRRHFEARIRSGVSDSGAAIVAGRHPPHSHHSGREPGGLRRPHERDHRRGQQVGARRETTARYLGPDKYLFS